jgi:hypothetical protein
MHPTLDQLHQLGLAGMARAFAELEANPTSASLSHAEWLAQAEGAENRCCLTRAEHPGSITPGYPAYGGKGR